MLPASPPAVAPGIAGLAQELQLPIPIATLLVNRGYSDVAAARAFLNPSLDQLHEPSQLLDMDRALERILRAIRQGEKISIHGDYDVDGTTSTVILKTAIEMCGGQAGFSIPHRLKDGYGIKLAAVERCAAEGVTLIVSVDTGIRAGEVVRRARELGIDVIVTDHHLPESALPPAVAVINPNRPGCGYPNKGLCGVGVTFKLVQALLSSLAWEPAKLRRVLQSFMKLAAIGTVADVVPLTGENRVIVKHGLAALRSVTSPGLRALLDVSRIAPGQAPSAREVAFRVAPRINAAGRMASADEVVELFLTRDAERARVIAAQLNDLNASRQAEEADVIAAILEACVQAPVDASQFALVFSAEGWHRGVLGIVASRLVTHFHRPVFVLGEEDGQAQGSGRSIAGFHLLDALDAMRELFLKYGGHSHAAGLTLAAASVDGFRTRFNAHAMATLTIEDLKPAIQIDACVCLADLNDAFYCSLQALEPFGAGNAAPVFAAFGVQVAAEPRLMKEKHIRVPLRQGARTIYFKGFHFAERAREFTPGSCVDIAFSIEEDSYNQSWAPILRAVRPTV